MHRARTWCRVMAATGLAVCVAGSVQASPGQLEINASDVRLGLSGFVVACKPDIAIGSGGGFARAGGANSTQEAPEPGAGACSAEVDGIAGTGDNLHIAHGTVCGFGDPGIDLDGRGAQVVDITSVGNAKRGIDLQYNDHPYVRDSVVLDNGQTGILVGDGSMIRDCIAGNNGHGALIASQGSQIRQSVSRGNHNGAATGFHGLIHGVVSTANNYGSSPGLETGHGLNVVGQNAVSDLSLPQGRLACESVGAGIDCR